MSKQFRLRKSAFTALTLAAMAVGVLSAINHSAAQQPVTGAKGTGSGATTAPATPPIGTGPAVGSPAGTDPTASTAAQKTLNDVLIGNSVAEGTANTAQYKDVSEAIEKFRAGDTDGARKQLQQAREKSSNKLPPVEIMVAKLLALSSQAAPARAELEHAVISNPKDPEPYLLFAEAALQERRVTDAESLLQRGKQLIEGYTDNPLRKKDFDIRANAALALVAEAREQWPQAAQFLDAWLKLDPDSVNAHQRMGRTQFQQGKADKARDEFAAAVKIDKNATKPYIFLAQMYEENKDHDKAKQAIDIALKQDPNDLNVHLQAARLALATNELKLAEQYADKALKIKSDSVDAMIARGTIARMNRDFKTAEKYLQDAVFAAPGNLDASNQLALVLVEQDDPAKQKRAAEIADLNMKATTQGNRFSPEAFSTAAWVMYKMGNVDRAAQIMKAVMQGGQLSQDGAYYLARILTDQKQNDQAMMVLKTAIDSPNPFSQREKAAELLEQLKKDQKDKAASSTPAGK